MGPPGPPGKTGSKGTRVSYFTIEGFFYPLKIMLYLTELTAGLKTLKHDSDLLETKPRIKNATVDSCFEVIGSRQHGVAASSRMFKTREVSCLLNALLIGPNLDVCRCKYQSLKYSGTSRERERERERRGLRGCG